jgi:DNA-binding winged helix-turn-helix (wHTH) protein
VTSSYRFGPFLIDRHAYRVVRDGETVAISPKHLDLLLHLVDHAGVLVTKEALLDAVWPDANVTDNALTQAVSELRQALGDDPSSPQFIKTVARRGYRFIAAIEPVPATVLQTTGPISTVARELPAAARGIAVLDFVNVTGDQETAWLSAGIAETVTGDLRALGDFRIVDRRRVLEATAAVGGSMQAVARETGANLIVTGSFQRSRERIRITARLVDAAGGEALADAKVDGPIEQIFELQDQIVVEFAREMGQPVQRAGGSRIGARETSSLDAYRAFTSGWLRLETLAVSELSGAVDDFRQAIAIDHRYALAHTGLACAQFATYETTRSDNQPARELLDEAIDHARHAVALDDGLAEAHAALGFLLVSRWETQEAVAETRRAVALEPGNWRHHFRVGHASWGDARLRAAGATLVHHPGFAFAHFQIAMVHVARGDLARAEAVLQQGGAVQDRQRTRHERFPALGLHWLLGLVHLAQGDVDAALADFDRELVVTDMNRLYGREYAMHARLGRGLACLAANRPADAILEFEPALVLYPNHAQTHLALAEAFRLRHETSRRSEHLAAADAAIGTLERSRPFAGALARSQRLAADGAIGEAVSALIQLLDKAPVGFAGWTIPVEPLLLRVRQDRAFSRIENVLALRAG